MTHARKLIIYGLAVLVLLAAPFLAGCAGCRTTDTGEREVVATVDGGAETDTQIRELETDVEEKEVAAVDDQGMREVTAVSGDVAGIDPSDLVDAFFAYDRADLTDEARERLRRNAQLLRAFPSARITIEGHCDERGTNEYNLGLGERRAAAVRDYLVSLGIDAGRIGTISYGEERPFAEGHNEAAWRQNRRAHFVLK